MQIVYRNIGREKHKIQGDQCIFMANSKSELDDHMKRRHVILIKCTMCEITTDTQSKMSEHEKGFHNIKNYYCGKCDKIFKFSEEMKQHVEIEHGQRFRRKKKEWLL